MTNSIPMLLLSYRMRTGVTQAQFAGMLGTTIQTVSRWERGVGIPQLFFRIRLCEILGVTPDYLSSPSQDEFTSEPSSILIDPLLPSSLVSLVGRTQELAHLRAWLDEEGHGSLVALTGLPGVGKTAVALALAHDATIRERFPDGVLWASLGPDAHPLDHLWRWASLLGIDDDDPHQLAQAICTRIGSRRMLVLLDDVWRLEDLAMLCVGGSNCTYLVTTRVPAIAGYTSTYLRVSPLGDDESQTLLLRLAPALQETHQTTLKMVLPVAHGLPLALSLMGNHLRMIAATGSPRRTINVLVGFRNRSHLFSLQEPNLSIGTHQPFPASCSVPAAIETSLSLLSQQASQALRSLCSLPSLFSENEALATASCTLDDLDALCDVGLLECLSGRYYFHPLLAEYTQFRFSRTTHEGETQKGSLPESPFVSPPSHGMMPPSS
jgi:transcriptional regulator with XRE-family HTH domain